jgi:ankyrin repeat protein
VSVNGVEGGVTQERILQVSCTSKTKVVDEHKLTNRPRRAAWAANRVIESDGDTPNGELLQRVISFSDLSDEPSTSKLHQAAKHGKGIAGVLQADETRAAIDALDNSGRAPLHWTVVRGQVEAMQHSISAGADIDAKDGYGKTPLICAVEPGNSNCARQLLNAKCCIDVADMDGETALHQAASTGSVNIVRLILSAENSRLAGAKAGARVVTAATPNKIGQLPLHRLAFVDEGPTADEIEKIARLLLDAHPDAIEATDSDGDTPATLAVIGDNLPMLHCLVAAGSSLAATFGSHRSLLHLAAARPSAPTISFIVEALQASGHRSPLIDCQQRDGGHNPWDIFIWSIYAPSWHLGLNRHASPAIQSAFADLYRHIRYTNLDHDITFIRDVLTALDKQDIKVACNYLYGLAEQKAESGNNNTAAWYRGLAKQIDAGEIDAATLGIKQDLEELKDELLSSPRDQDSHYDYLATQSQWLEHSDSSFWIEPATAFVRGSPDQESSDEEKQDEKESRLPIRRVDFSLITQIYSDRAQLLYDRKTASCDPQEYLDQYKPRKLGMLRWSDLPKYKVSSYENRTECDGGKK